MHRPMSTTLLYVLAENQPGANGLVVEAAERVFPKVRVREVLGMEDAQGVAPAGFGEFVVLVEPDTEALEAALTATDESRLPRWPVLEVASTCDADDVVVLGKGQWK